MDIKKRQFKSYIFTGEKKTCSGCGTCAQICKHKALTMKPDEEGFLYPIRDVQKCINCGLCDIRCPEVTDRCNPSNEEQHCYIATTPKEEYYKESASIGICTMLADYVISQDGLVFGCFLDEETWTAYHKGVTDREGVFSIRNSKYLQSDTKGTFVEVQKALNIGKKVLYIGTPCQIAGLKAYLHRAYKNLFTVDLFCHGTFSAKLMTYEVNYWEKRFKSKIKNFRFRSKRLYPHSNGGMVNFDIEKDGKIVHVERFAGSSPTYRCFAYRGDGKSYNLRLACYCCPFKSSTRYADISVGDPWLIKKEVINDSKLGPNNSIRSLYSVNTKKGGELISHIAKYLYQKEYDYSSVFVQPAVCNDFRDVPVERKEIFSRIKKEDYGSLVQSLFNCNLEKEHKDFVVNYRKEQIKRFLKKIIRYDGWKK